MALTVRYVAANAAQGLDGLTLANAMNLNDALRNPSGNSEYRILQGTHVVTGSIAPVPTGLTLFAPAYYVGCTDISGLSYADYQVSGNRQRIDHLPKIMMSGAVTYSTSNANYLNFANIAVSGTVNGGMWNITSFYNMIQNCWFFNMSTGSNAAAIGLGFKNTITHSSALTSGITDFGIAINIGNASAIMAYKCYVSAPSGDGFYINNNCHVIDCVIDNCKRGIHQAASSEGFNYIFGNTFVNCNQYCASQRNAIVTHSGMYQMANNLAYNSGPILRLVDANGTPQDAYTTGMDIRYFNNIRINTSVPSGYEPQMLLSSPTGNISATDLFVDVSGHDLRFTARATGIYNRNPFGESVGSTSLANTIRTPRLS